MYELRMLGQADLITKELTDQWNKIRINQMKKLNLLIF